MSASTGLSDVFGFTPFILSFAMCWNISHGTPRYHALIIEYFTVQSKSLILGNYSDIKTYANQPG